MKSIFLLFFLLVTCHAEGRDHMGLFLQDYCFTCHDEDSTEVDLDLKELFSQKPLVKNIKKWRHILHLVQEGDMPPKDKKKQPTAKERMGFYAKLKNELESFDYSKVKNPGSEPVRRMTNIELENTLNELFGTSLKILDKLNPDLSTIDGFTKDSETLYVQTAVLEKNYAAIEYFIKEALPLKTNSEAAKKSVAEFYKGAEDKSRTSASYLIKRFMDRAYRRPVSDTDFNKTMQLFDSFRKVKPFEESINNTIEFILASPRFLMKVEDRTPSGIVGQWDMASRLSYFLWGAMPDNELFQLAKDGQLQKEPILKSQIERMTKDPKFQYLGRSLGAEWLRYIDIGVRNRPDPIDNPKMTDTLYKAMYDESTLFFTYLFKKNKPVKELILADYTFLNEELARYYRIGGIRGSHMRPVRLKTKHRGGILSHASILMVTSHPGRSSPILRGNWILTYLLGTPPPPPPADVGEIDDDDDDIEDALKRHSSKKQCASCHNKIDPLGLGLKNFDEVGRWRNDEPAKVQLEDGTRFTGLNGLKKVIVENMGDDLKRQLIEKAMSFALGRRLQYYDEPAVRKVLEVLKQPGAGLRDMLIAIVQSYPFRYNNPINTMRANHE